jgi:hypothetical protein
VHPTATGGEGGRESGLGHEGAAEIPIEAKIGWKLTGNRASHGGEARAERNDGGGIGQRSMQ